MKYFAIDIETTGLIPGSHKIVEFGAVFDDGITPVAELPRFQRVIKQEDCVWNMFCIGMHRDWYFETVKDENKCINELALMGEFLTWIQSVCPMPKTKILAAGKNFGSFDFQFIKHLPNFEGKEWYHRSLDPTMYYIDWINDKVSPDLKTCMKRAGLDWDDSAAHRAIYDAESVVKLIRRIIHSIPKFEALDHGTKSNI